MQIGDIDVVNTLINTEIRLSVLEKAFDFILSKNYSLTKPSQQEIEKFRQDALKELQTRYPNMGIQGK